MRISTFFYTLKQGFANVFRNKWSTLATLATISACIFVFGIAYSLLMNFQFMIKNAEEGVSITVFFEEGMTEEQILEIENTIKVRFADVVANTNYISADAAWEEFSAELGEAAEGITENPLTNSANIEIYLKDVSAQTSLVKKIEDIEGVRR